MMQDGPDAEPVIWPVVAGAAGPSLAPLLRYHPKSLSCSASRYAAAAAINAPASFWVSGL